MPNAPAMTWHEGSEAAGRGRVDLVGRAVKMWTGELVDLGGRNTLLYYRDLKQGTLDIGPRSAANPVVVDALPSSQTVRLWAIFGEPAITAAPPRDPTSVENVTQELAKRPLPTLSPSSRLAPCAQPPPPP